MYSTKKIPAPFQGETRERTPAPPEAKTKCAGTRKKEAWKANPALLIVVLLLCCCN